MTDVQYSYDQVAAHYAEHLYGELAHKPFDRRMLDWLIEKCGGGLICDMGCGPGQIGRYLADHGARVEGIDLSPGMITQAGQLNPDIAYWQGDMTALTGVRDQMYDGIAAVYAIVNLPPDRLAAAFGEFRRILRPGGAALISFHIGSETRHLDDWWGYAVNLNFYFYEREAVKARLTGAGLELEECIERDPYPEPAEVQTRRAYLFCRRPA